MFFVDWTGPVELKQFIGTFICVADDTDDARPKLLLYILSGSCVCKQKVKTRNDLVIATAACAQRRLLAMT